MPHRCAHIVPVCLVCAATLGGHFFIARKLDARRDLSTDVADTYGQLIWKSGPVYAGEPVQLIGVDSTVEAMATLPDEAPDPRAIPRLLATLGYETLAAEIDGPADALRPVSGDEPPARPLSRREREDQAEVREVIDEEMSEASAEERDIWFEELKSLPAEVVRDLLEVRRQMRVLSPDHPLSRPSPLVTGETAQPREIVAEPVMQSRPVTGSDWSDSRAALQAAIDWATHNIANADTIGYKRIEIYFSDAMTPASDNDGPNGRGCRLANIRLDATPGELVETGRTLDLAIAGPGYFVLQDTDAPTGRILTRRGLLTRNESGALCVDAGQKCYVIEPQMILPADMISLAIRPNGEVHYRTTSSDEPIHAGRIHLTVLGDESQLISAGSGMFQLPPGIETELINAGESGAGVLQQGFLEASNVDLEREQTQRDKWEAMLKLLPVQVSPRTANGANRTPQ